MKKSLNLAAFICLLLVNNIYAQQFIAMEFYADPEDQSAVESGKYTIGGMPCALVKVITSNRELLFDSPGGIVDVLVKEDGYWVFVEGGETSILLMSKGYSLSSIELPEPARELTVYVLNLGVSGYPMLDQYREMITFRLNEEQVFIQYADKAPVLADGNHVLFSVPAGEQPFRFLKDGYVEQLESFDAKYDEVVDIQMIPASDGVSGRPATNTTMMSILSEPAGAEIVLNGQKMGMTPYHGQQIAGEYELVLSAQGYFPHYEVIGPTQNGSFDLPLFELKPYSGFIQVTSIPAEAEVFINGELKGTTPYKRSRLKTGDYTLRVRKPLYHQYTEGFRVDYGDEKLFNVTLREAFGELSVFSTPTGADIFIGSNKHASNTPADIRLPEGSFMITIKKDNFPTLSQNVIISEGRKSEIQFDLQGRKSELLAQSVKLKNSKVTYGIASLAAAGIGTYFMFSASQLSRKYPDATTNATVVYDRMEMHNLFSYVAFGAVVPLGALFFSKNIQHKRINNQFSMYAAPLESGAMAGISLRF